MHSRPDNILSNKPLQVSINWLYQYNRGGEHDKADALEENGDGQAGPNSDDSTGDTGGGPTVLLRTVASPDAP